VIVLSNAFREKSKFYRILFLAIFLFVIDKASEFFLPTLPGGVKHFLLLTLFILNWVLSGSHLFKINETYYKILVINLFYVIILFFNTDVNPINFSLGVGFTFLFSFIFFFAVNTRSNVNTLFSFFKISVFIFILFGLFTVIPSLFFNLSINKHYFGFFRELGAFGAVMNITCILCISLFIKTRNKYFLFLAALCSFFIFLTIMKKSIISNVIIWFFFQSMGQGFKQKITNFIFLFLGLGIFLYAVSNELTENISANVEYYENAGESHVRLVMYSTAYQIAFDNFPFGSGLGTFGSLPSLYGGYSNTYFKYDIDYIEPLSPERVASGEGHTLFDTYWPHIIGELGVLGFLLFLFLWLYPIKVAISVMKNSNELYIKALCFYVISIGIIMTMDGVVLYTPEISSFILFHSGLTGLCLYHISKYNKSSILLDYDERIR
jgi:hypothetical protein